MTLVRSFHVCSWVMSERFNLADRSEVKFQNTEYREGSTPKHTPWEPHDPWWTDWDGPAAVRGIRGSYASLNGELQPPAEAYFKMSQESPRYPPGAVDLENLGEGVYVVYFKLSLCSDVMFMFCLGSVYNLPRPTTARRQERTKEARAKSRWRAKESKLPT